MKNLLLTIQLFFFCVFVAIFTSSFFVIDQIKEKSKTVVTAKVVEGTISKIEFTEELLNSKAAQRYLADYQLETIRDEIQSFKDNPYSYVESITLDATQSVILPAELNSNNPLKRALVEKVFSWKSGLKSYFESTFKNLITDLRIFILSNIIALFIAILVCIKQKILGKESLIVSSILTGVIALSSLSYLNQNWLFSIILNSYSGYGYPIGILALTSWLYYEYYKTKTNC